MRCITKRGRSEACQTMYRVELETMEPSWTCDVSETEQGTRSLCCRTTVAHPGERRNVTTSELEGRNLLERDPAAVSLLRCGVFVFLLTITLALEPTIAQVLKRLRCY